MRSAPESVLVRMYVPLLQAAENPRVVMVTSAGGAFSVVLDPNQPVSKMHELAYSSSKAALNMAWSSLALEAKPRGIACILFSPGWVKTRMGGGGAEITTEESVGDLRATIETLTIADSGRFLRRDGSELPW